MHELKTTTNWHNTRPEDGPNIAYCVCGTVLVTEQWTGDSDSGFWEFPREPVLAFREHLHNVFDEE